MGEIRQTRNGKAINHKEFNRHAADAEEPCAKKRYEYLCEILSRMIQRKMIEYKMENISVNPGQSSSTIYISKKYDSFQKLLILIQDFGDEDLRAGEWSHCIEIYDSVSKGSQLLYIRQALDSDFAVLVMTPNNPELRDDDSRKAYALSVWKFVNSRTYTTIAIVAHGNGGRLVTHMYEKDENFIQRVSKIAFIDSKHSFERHLHLLPPMQSIAIHYKTTTCNDVDVECINISLDSPQMASPNEKTAKSTSSCDRSGLAPYIALPMVIEFFEMLSESSSSSRPAVTPMNPPQNNIQSPPTEDKSRHKNWRDILYNLMLRVFCWYPIISSCSELPKPELAEPMRIEIPITHKLIAHKPMTFKPIFVPRSEVENFKIMCEKISSKYKSKKQSENSVPPTQSQKDKSEKPYKPPPPPTYPKKYSNPDIHLEKIEDEPEEGCA